MEGVRVDHLHCPTCGLSYPLPITIKRECDEQEFDVDAPLLIAHIVDKPITPWRPYIECPNEHRWSVVTIWRGPGVIDSVRLGQYIGGGQLVS